MPFNYLMRLSFRLSATFKTNKAIQLFCRINLCMNSAPSIYRHQFKYVNASEQDGAIKFQEKTRTSID